MATVVVPEFGDPSVMELRDVEPDDPGPGEVRIDVEGIGVNWFDVDNRRGRYPGQPEPPLIPGCEVSGVIAAVGPGVEEWSTGDEVASFVMYGGYAETVVTPARWLFPKPEGLDLVEAGGALITGFTAHNVVHEWGGLNSEETVLVYAAAGGVGSMAVQIASAAGATVIATASTEEKLAFAAECGADHLVNYERTDVVEAVEDVAPGGVDLVLDGVGGDAFQDGLELLEHGGRIVAYGAASGTVPSVSTPSLYMRNATLRGYTLNLAMRELPEKVLEARQPLYEGWASGTFDPNVTDVRPLSDTVAVHEKLETRKTTGKIVLTP